MNQNSSTSEATCVDYWCKGKGILGIGQIILNNLHRVVTTGELICDSDTGGPVPSVTFGINAVSARLPASTYWLNHY